MEGIEREEEHLRPIGIRFRRSSSKFELSSEEADDDLERGTGHFWSGMVDHILEPMGMKDHSHMDHTKLKT